MRSPSVVWPRGLNPGALAVLVCSLLVWSLLVLAGCDSGGSPGQTSSASVTASAGPSESATLSATPTPTATPSGAYKPADASGPAQNVPVPVLPEVAKTRTKEGLEAFTRYWYETLSYAYETGDLTFYDGVAPTTCVACEQVREVIRNWHAEGRWLVGGGITTPTVETNFISGADGKYKVAVQVRQDPLAYMRADGTIARTDEQVSDRGNLLLVSNSAGQWSVDEIGSIVG
nr:DUF6318 family protein [Arthrobacter sp. ZBG10]